MKVTFQGDSDIYAIGVCGVVNLDHFEGQEKAVENKAFQYFEKKELFWTIYDQIIIPTREKMDADKDDTFRLLYIEDDDDNFVFYYNIDDYDETYFEVNSAAEMTLENVISVLYEDLCNMAKSLPDDELLKKALTKDENRSVNIPKDYLQRLKSDVFYSSWDIDTMEE